MILMRSTDFIAPNVSLDVPIDNTQDEFTLHSLNTMNKRILDGKRFNQPVNFIHWKFK